MFFSRYASRVTMLVRGSALSKGMFHYLVEQISGTEKIEALTRTVVVEVHGEDRLDAVTFKNTETGESETRDVPVMFLFIGAEAHTELVAGVVERNSGGFIPTGPDLMRKGSGPRGRTLRRDPYVLETNVPGIFAAGDVRQGAVRRVASAVDGSGRHGGQLCSPVLEDGLDRQGLLSCPK